MRKCSAASTNDVRRQGSTLVFAMIALLVTSLIGASLLRNSFISMQQVKREQWHLQAHWLAEAGCQRAISRLKKEPAFGGEDWSVPAEQMKSPFPAIVTITVSGTDPGSARTITATAEYPTQAMAPFRIKKQLTIRQQAETK